ncbi:hypothetical protein Goshw_003159 [Gossypium schwendimanii]|uniref:Uncharacterized protein n=1 Tax=Gossypium schwendimanii TaxID=34291 RepID=A0A7J9MQW6_GOSSC|nr:hypothetical protein [Gossypium schwendimanii]
MYSKFSSPEICNTIFRTFYFNGITSFDILFTTKCNFSNSKIVMRFLPV